MKTLKEINKEIDIEIKKMKKSFDTRLIRRAKTIHRTILEDTLQEDTVLNLNDYVKITNKIKLLEPLKIRDKRETKQINLKEFIRS